MVPEKEETHGSESKDVPKVPEAPQPPTHEAAPPDNTTDRPTADNTIGRPTPDNTTDQPTHGNLIDHPTPENVTGRPTPDNTIGRPTNDTMTGRPTHDSIMGRPTYESAFYSVQQDPSFHSIQPDPSYFSVGEIRQEDLSTRRGSQRRDTFNFHSTRMTSGIGFQLDEKSEEPPSLPFRIFLAYFCWLVTGFFFGWHWLVLIFFGLKKKEKFVALGHIIAYWMSFIMFIAGGVAVWGNAEVCPDTDAKMTRECLYTNQTVDFQSTYTLCYIGLSNLAVMFVLDGSNLHLWIREQYRHDWLRLWGTKKTSIVSWVYLLFILITDTFVVLTWALWVDWESTELGAIVGGIIGGIALSSVFYWGLVKIPIFHKRKSPDIFERYRDIERRVRRGTRKRNSSKSKKGKPRLKKSDSEFTEFRGGSVKRSNSDVRTSMKMTSGSDVMNSQTIKEDLERG